LTVAQAPADLPAAGVVPQPAAARVRMLSLDVFRGLTIAGMILVNNPGTSQEVYHPLEHADWNGCTPTDLIFPFFLFIVGVAITLSFAQRVERGDRQWQLMRKILWRTMIIFGLGIVLNGFPFFEWSTLRIPGVLQRIAVCYLVASLIVLRLDIRGQIAATVLLVVGYWVIMKVVPVPGFGAGGLGPGKNLAAYIDDTGIPKAFSARCRRRPRRYAACWPVSGCARRATRWTAWRGCSWSAMPRWLPASSPTPGSRSTRICGPAPTCCSPRAWR